MNLQHRHNIYDGEEEFWVVTKETGKRQESQSLEEVHEKQSKACQWGPTFSKIKINHTSSKHHEPVLILTGHSFWHSLYTFYLDSCFFEADGEPEFQFADMFKGNMETARDRQGSEKKMALDGGPKAETKFGQAGFYIHVSNSRKCFGSRCMVSAACWFIPASRKTDSSGLWKVCWRNLGSFEAWPKNWNRNIATMMEPNSVMLSFTTQLSRFPSPPQNNTSRN